MQKTIVTELLYRVQEGQSTRQQCADQHDQKVNKLLEEICDYTLVDVVQVPGTTSTPMLITTVEYYEKGREPKVDS